ncbi:MAG TPA: hypothetical protein VK452_06585 [Dissulfurispiraceae bacterium]|nr:hypothetical protein [Dissulfurispiraceae bacterium]
MVSTEGARLSNLLNQKVAALKDACRGLDEKTASSAPTGRWSPKEIISHLCGKNDSDAMSIIQPFLDSDNARIDLESGNSFFTDDRAKMTLADLLVLFEQRYKLLSDRAALLTDKQLAKTAHIPLLKESSIGEHPTLAKWLEAIAEYHLNFHIDHLKEIRQALLS